ncbi:protein kinase [Streptomyces sp. NPDC059171]|uniref:protein kinase n=1 Tax=Streptomyces sp. NPDC059171 TaxID=3346755 RepID=UPI0036C971FA
MDDYAGRVLADRYRLPLPPSDGYELAETRAFDTYSGQEVLVRQVPLPEIVDAEVLDADGRAPMSGRPGGRAVRRSTDPAVRRAIEAAQAAAQVPDHPRLDQVFDVFAEADSLWIVSELVAARPLAALLAERPLTPYRAAEIGSDVLTALRVLHAHGWTHRNITVRTVLVCDDGRVMLTGLAAGAAEEALCGYAPAPRPDADPVAGPTTYGIPAPEPTPPRELGGVPALPAAGSDADVRESAGGQEYAEPEEYAEPDSPEGYGGREVYGDREGYDGREGYGDREVYGGREGYGQEGGRSREFSGSRERRMDRELPVPPLPLGYVPRREDDADAPYDLPPGHEASPARDPWADGGEAGPVRGQWADGGETGTAGRQEADSEETGSVGGPWADGEETGPVRDPWADGEETGPARDPWVDGGETGPVREQRADGQEIVPRPAAPAVPYNAVPPPAEPGAASAAQLRAARAGAIAAYRAGARAAARISEDRRQTDRAPADLTNPPQEGGATASADLTKRPQDGRATAPDAGTASTAGPAGDADRPGAAATGSAPDAAGAPHAPGAPVGGSDAPDARALPFQRPTPGAPRLTAPWGSPGDEPYDDEDDEDDGEAPRPPGRRVHLAGTWDDGPGAGRPVSAGGSGADALRADSRRPAVSGSAAKEAARTAPLPAARTTARAWEDAVTGGEPAVYRGPATPLAAERARQARIAVVGPVTERWAPEQAGPVHENWQLAPPIGPSTDLWALGALLYRAVQGHAPYPEESAAELVQMVCGEPPAFAEECGPLRPVVESLLRQDPTERPDFEELRGWLRSLVRSAPEPEAGADVVPLPAPDAARLPVVRRRGELVRRRWGRFGGSGAGRHRQGSRRQPPTRPGGVQRDHSTSLLPPDRSVRGPVESWEDERPARAPRAPKGPRALREPPRRGEGSPRKLGRLLLVLVLLLMAAAIAYAVMFMPKAEPGRDDGAPAPTGSAAPPAASGEPAPSGPADGSAEPGSQKPQTSRSAAALAPGYTLRKDAEGFEVGVPEDWQRSPANADRQIRYGSDGFTLLVVPGRDTVKSGGSDPLDYQRDKEPELQPFRDSSWSSSSGLRRVDVGRQAMAEGQFTWQESGGREVFVRNLAMIVDGRYHVIQAIGPENDRDKVTEIYEQAIASYRIAN